MNRRNFLALPLLGVLSACAGPAPQRAKLEKDLAQRVRITSVSVDTSALGKATGSGRSVPARDVKAALERASKSRLVGLGGGSNPATVILRLTSVDLITAAQSYVIGGESVMRGTVAVVETSNGRILMEPVKVSSGGGGWVLGGLVGVLTMDETAVEVEQLSNEFAKRAATLIAG